MATQGGPASNVSVVSDGRVRLGGPAIPVAVVTDGRVVEGGPALPVYVVTSGPVQGGPAMPVVAAAAGAPARGGPAYPIYVVNGSFAPPIDPTMAYTNKVKALSPIAYWPMAEASGSVALDESGNSRNGAYTAVTLGQTGIGDGRTAASFDGTNSFVNSFSASLQSAFNKDEGTVALWFKIGFDGWANGVAPNFLTLQADGNNRVVWFKTGGGALTLRYQAGGTQKNVTFSPVQTAFVHLALTWSKAADRVIGYLNGVQQGATLTALGVWAGLLATTTTVIAAGSTAPTATTLGSFAHVAIWSTPLSAAQIASLVVVP